ncbi:WD-40 repeat protein [Reticulomyxa filosa]|uniref:WD-40 repeat protein n=1 Tax=Reticulomyxa filosa TaxID=46433 RepID=X6MK40_RETFI|nr:WD-40 repeat protein [Reticulomyxa filosa]|eukprot:ETO13410.1 WD-40 repeat protein [Reticulomyxa filosa]
MAVWSVDYSTFDDCQFICSGSDDKTVRVWDVDNNKQIQSFNGHSSFINCVKFSHIIIIIISKMSFVLHHLTKLFQLQIFNEYGSVNAIEFSPFNGGRYLCSGSLDKRIGLYDIETSKLLHVFNGHKSYVWCVDISPLQSNNNKMNNIGVIGGNGYTICSGSCDNTIRIWDIETAKQFNVFNGHELWIKSIKYGSNELSNTILSGSNDKSVRLWDIRYGKQIQVFNGHTGCVRTVEYSPFVIKNNIGNSNVICSGSLDNTIRFWDIRSNKEELYTIKGINDEADGILCIKYISLKKKVNEDNYGIYLYYGSKKGHIRVWG